MASNYNYKAAIITIYRKKKIVKYHHVSDWVSEELLLEIPPDSQRIINRPILKEEPPQRGICILNLYGDEKI
jgi:hypothetical protein